MQKIIKVSTVDIVAFVLMVIALIAIHVTFLESDALDDSNLDNKNGTSLKVQQNASAPKSTIDTLQGALKVNQSANSSGGLQGSAGSGSIQPTSTQKNFQSTTN